MSSKHDKGHDLPSQEQLSFVMTLPTHQPVEVRHYVRRNDGMEDIAKKTADALAKSGGELVVPGVSPSSIQSSLATVAKLQPIEDALYPYYRRAYENRLEADSEVMSAVLKTWRMIAASGDRTLMDRFKFLGDWIARHHAHGAHQDTPPPAPPPATT